MIKELILSISFTSLLGGGVLTTNKDTFNNVDLSIVTRTDVVVSDLPYLPSNINNATSFVIHGNQGIDVTVYRPIGVNYNGNSFYYDFALSNIPSISTDSFIFTRNNVDFNIRPFLLFYVDDNNYFCYYLVTAVVQNEDKFFLSFGFKNDDHYLDNYCYNYLYFAHYSIIHIHGGLATVEPSVNASSEVINIHRFDNLGGGGVGTFLAFYSFYRPFTYSSNHVCSINISTYYNLLNVNDYNSGYDTGKNDGLAEGYENGYRDGERVGYAQGTADGQNLGNTFVDILLTIADIPIYIIYNMTNFNLFGISLFIGIMSLFTLSIVIFVIKHII